MVQRKQYLSLPILTYPKFMLSSILIYSKRSNSGSWTDQKAMHKLCWHTIHLPPTSKNKSTNTKKTTSRTIETTELKGLVELNQLKNGKHPTQISNQTLIISKSNQIIIYISHLHT